MTLTIYRYNDIHVCIAERWLFDLTGRLILGKLIWAREFEIANVPKETENICKQVWYVKEQGVNVIWKD